MQEGKIQERSGVFQREKKEKEAVNKTGFMVKYYG